MNGLKFLTKRIFLALLVVLVSECIASNTHEVYLETPNTVPSYCQEAINWCGAATAQMILEGYPGGVEHQFNQTYIWNRIVAHRDDPGANWATDPDGMKDTLMELGGDPGVNWDIKAKTNAQSVMYSIVYWMTRRQYPTAVLVDPGGSPYGSFQHWVVIDGFTTDVDPTTSNTVNLQLIEIVDPWNPPCPTATFGGLRSLVNGSTWYSTYWGVPGNYSASKWHGNYVAVVEPPVKEGLVRAAKQVENGKPISEGQAIEFALKWYRELNLEKRSAYAPLRGTVPLKPFLVNQEKKGFYLVPFGYKEGDLSQGAILVNAYNGDFQEAGVFLKPFKYMSKDRAVKLAVNYLCACREPQKRIAARTIFKPSEYSQSRFLPIWEIKVDQLTVFVTQLEKVVTVLKPLLPGD